MYRLVPLLWISTFAFAGPPEVGFRESPGRLDILIGTRVVATYVYHDEQIPRPYFCGVRAPDGTPITRRHPPDPLINKGNDDHPAYHPGIWLAFGDLSGADSWRNEAKVSHVEFLRKPESNSGSGVFSVVNAYSGQDGKAICKETCLYRVLPGEPGWILTAESEFVSPDADFAFGDQEEMGFGVRIDTPLTKKFGNGAIRNSNGQVNEKEVWGRQADWCAFSGSIDGKECGLLLMSSPRNFRKSWYHVRDYGLLVANPFGKKAMTGADDAGIPPDSTRVRKGEPFRLGFGAYVFSSPDKVDFTAVYGQYLELLSKKK